METINLSGVGVALITPFKPNDDVDFNALSQLVEMHLRADTDYLVALGTTAETPTLSPEEQHEIKQLVVEKVQGKLPVVLGLGGNNTRALLNTLEKTDLRGINALLSVTPYYNKPSQEGLLQHYRQLSKISPLPIILYNVPSRTGVNMCAETTLKIANECENVVAIKEASGMNAQIDAIVRRRPDGFRIISGDDGITLPLMSIGVDGVISVIGNAFPKEIKQMVHLALKGDFPAASAIHRQLGDFFDAIFIDGNPAGVKCLMWKTGLCENILRLPLVPVSNLTDEKITVALEKFTANR
ncbi:MAG: 4-hydroxy-tetrahydrodipicolinate synthase [Dysgonamonadaceae bacterium]|jgi:4-hydroxy-tetrahydrodipicolinate synthase|nr:4-hydroxy-tetrahydrodipicolinate synthase [Dysgonamonadaceae bacterium]